MKKSSQNSEIELSVIVVNFDTGKLLAQCIKSISAETGELKSPKTEIIIVDNASSDDSLKEALKLDIPVTVIKNNENIGYAKSNNQAIRKAEGRYLLLLNPDTKVEKGAISSLLEFARETEDAGVVGPKLLNSDGSTQDSVFNFPTITNALREYWLGQKEAYSKYSPETDSPVPVDVVVGAAFLITPQAKQRVGYLDERYFMYFEDLDYCRRTWQAGLKVYYLPEARITHYHGASGVKLAPGEEQWKRLIPSSKIYHGRLKHYLTTFILWSGQKLRRVNEA